MAEIWKPVPGFGNHYEASSLGRARSKARIVRKRMFNGVIASQKYGARILAGSNDGRGYKVLHLSVGGKKIRIGAHRMVAMAFHGLPKEGHECCHNNGVSFDNRPENLRWDTHLNNNRDRLRHGTYATGTDHPMNKFCESFVSTVESGRIDFARASAAGMSKTHYYRLRRRGLRAARLEADSVAMGVLK